MSFHTMTARDALTALWSLGGLPAAALDKITLTGHDPVFPILVCYWRHRGACCLRAGYSR